MTDVDTVGTNHHMVLAWVYTQVGPSSRRLRCEYCGRNSGPDGLGTREQANAAPCPALAQR